MAAPASPIQAPDYLKQLLDEFDGQPGDFREARLTDALRGAASSHRPLDEQARRAHGAEWTAFLFAHSALDEKSVWGTHFSWTFSGKTAAGEVKYFPNVEEVDVAMVEYWARRLNDARHPAMRARYADLLWDLRKRVTGEANRVEDARVAVEAYLQAVERPKDEGVIYSVGRIQRALEIAVSINDGALVETVRDAMFRFHDRCADPQKIGTCVWLFDTLDGHKKVVLTEAQEQRMVGDLERILDEATKAGGEPDAWLAEAVGKRLKNRFARQGRRDDVKRVVLAYGRAYEALAARASAMFAMSWLQNVQDDYRNVGLKDEADRVLVMAKAMGKQAREEMGAVETKFEISQQEMDDFIAKVTEGKLEDALVRIASQFVPSIARAQDMMKWAMENTPFQALVTHTIISEDQIVAQIGSTEEDEEGRLVMHLRQEIESAAFYLALGIDATRRKFNCTADDIMRFVGVGSLFDPQRHGLVQEGLAAYLDGDHVKAIHVLVPQVEHALRVLLAALGRPTNKPMLSSKGVMQEKGLNDILKEPAMTAWAEKSGTQDWLAYLRCLLNDPRGLNLRNRLAHGLMGPDEFGRQVSDRVLHVLLMLSLVRRTP